MLVVSLSAVPRSRDVVVDLSYLFHLMKYGCSKLRDPVDGMTL